MRLRLVDKEPHSRKECKAAKERIFSRRERRDHGGVWPRSQGTVVGPSPRLKPGIRDDKRGVMKTRGLESSVVSLARAAKVANRAATVTFFRDVLINRDLVISKERQRLRDL